MPFAVATLLFLVTSSVALSFPDTTQLFKQYRVAKRHHGQPVHMEVPGSPDSLRADFKWSGDSLEHIIYSQTSPYDQAGFQSLAQVHGQGASWHEEPLTVSQKTQYLYPGLEQQWVLQGYSSVSGWLGSGFQESRFYLVFRQTPPFTLRQPAKGPFRYSTVFLNSIKESAGWGAAACPDMVTGDSCYKFQFDDRIILSRTKDKPELFRIWFRENNPIGDIQSAIRSLPNLQKSEYAADLSRLTITEARTVLMKLSQILPELFNWPSRQIQDLKTGQVPSNIYMSYFGQYGKEWPHVRVFSLHTPDANLVINLHFNGHYELIFGQ